MRVLICGGRDYYKEYRVAEIIEELKPSLIIQGGASGADMCAKSIANEKGIPTLEFPADWRTHGRSAGPIRNKKMLYEGRPDIVVAFPGGRGTDNMVRQAHAAGVTVRRES